MTKNQHINMLLAFAPSIADETICEVLNRSLPFRKGSPVEALVNKRIENCSTFEQHVDLLDEILEGEGRVEGLLGFKRFPYPADVVITARVEMAQVARNLEKHIIEATRRTDFVRSLARERVSRSTFQRNKGGAEW